MIQITYKSVTPDITLDSIQGGAELITQIAHVNFINILLNINASNSPEIKFEHTYVYLEYNALADAISDEVEQIDFISWLVQITNKVDQILILSSNTPYNIANALNDENLIKLVAEGVIMNPYIWAIHQRQKRRYKCQR